MWVLGEDILIGCDIVDGEGELSRGRIMWYMVVWGNREVFECEWGLRRSDEC